MLEREHTVSNFTKHPQMMVFSFLLESERRSGRMEVNIMLQLWLGSTVLSKRSSQSNMEEGTKCNKERKLNTHTAHAVYERFVYCGRRNRPQVSFQLVRNILFLFSFKSYTNLAAD